MRCPPWPRGPSGQEKDVLVEERWSGPWPEGEGERGERELSAGRSAKLSVESLSRGLGARTAWAGERGWLLHPTGSGLQAAPGGTCPNPDRERVVSSARRNV